MWINLSLIAAFFFAARILVIKKYLSGVDVLFMAFMYRALGLVMLIALYPMFESAGFTSQSVWKVAGITAVITAAASIIQLVAIKKFEISASVPYLSFTPVFMILPVYFLFKEIPQSRALGGIVLIIAGAFILNVKGASFKKSIIELAKNKGGWLYLAVAFLFGISTTLDRVAIEASNGYTYTLVWHIISTGLFLPVLFNKTKLPEYKQNLTTLLPAFLLQAAFGIIAFLCQMGAVGITAQIAANVLYVKALTMLQLFFTVFLGIVLLKEHNAWSRLAGSTIMIGGAVVVILFY
ncbi:MAG: DMT family transporter [Fibrobacteria bacterium]|nr:DMT family transporter [Fibrobacteria bacterium]